MPADPSPVPQPPSGVHTSAELAAALDALRQGRSFRDLHEAAGPEGLPKSTISDLLSGTTQPTQGTLERYLRACGVPRGEWAAWQAARERAVSALSARVIGLTRVEDADPRRLGVHKPIDAPGATATLPAYIPRDADAGPSGLRALVRRASRRGGMVVLAGGSSVGKTRCAFEAIQDVVPQWWLLHPADAGQVRRVAEDPPGRLVVWLDELQRYLGGGDGLTAATARTLMNKGAVLIATLWPDRYASYTQLPGPGQPDLHERERELLRLGEVVHLDATLSPAEQERAHTAAAGDSRIELALKSHDYGLFQVIAAAPQLIDRWKSADPYAAAVLHTAIDAARLGVRSPLTADMLRAAAPGYCDDRQCAAAPTNWFEAAMAYATGQLHGAAAALAPTAAPEVVGHEAMGQATGYLAAEYLQQHAGNARHTASVPASFWNSALTHLQDSEDMIRLAESASNRMLYQYAVPLFRRAADAGHRTAADRWAVCTGDPAGLENLWVRAIVQEDGEDCGVPACEAASRLTEALVRLGDLDKLRELSNSDSLVWLRRKASRRLAQVLAGRGATLELQKLADRGDHAAGVYLANILARQANGEQLRARARSEASHAATLPGGQLPARWRATLRGRWHTPPMAACARLADYLAHRGEIAELAARTDMPAAKRLFTLLRHRGDLAGLRQLAEERGGEIGAEFIQVLAHRGDNKGLRALVPGADKSLLRQIAEVHIHRGAIREIEELARHQRTDEVSSLLASVLADRGEIGKLRELAAHDHACALHLANVLADQGDLAALRELGAKGVSLTVCHRVNTYLVNRGLLDDLEARADQGDADAAKQLARTLAARGDTRAAQRILRKYGDSLLPDSHEEEPAEDIDWLATQADQGDQAADLRLAAILVQRGDLGLLKARARDGNDGAASYLAPMLADRGEIGELASLADSSDWHARHLARVLAHRGHIGELTIRADHGDHRARDRLHDLLVHRGDLDILRHRADAGDASAGTRWARMAADRGDADSLRAHAGDYPDTDGRLAELLIDRGEISELRRCADASTGHSRFARVLADMLADRGEIGELRTRASNGDPAAQRMLAEVLADRRETGELRARVSDDPRDDAAAACLVELLVEQGDPAGAERILRAQVSAGHFRAAREVPEVLVRAGRHDEARQLARYGLNIDGSLAAPLSAGAHRRS